MFLNRLDTQYKDNTVTEEKKRQMIMGPPRKKNEKKTKMLSAQSEKI